ncbi:MAG: hypothetical protein DMG28_13980 [Acidobacteria bacterium]|nr:MAG: hypothetical protein DMG28_13980 [Acidobacteriota bacterium]
MDRREAFFAQAIKNQWESGTIAWAQYDLQVLCQTLRRFLIGVQQAIVKLVFLQKAEDRADKVPGAPVYLREVRDLVHVARGEVFSPIRMGAQRFLH